jgi:hypothetical protein
MLHGTSEFLNNELMGKKGNIWLARILVLIIKRTWIATIQ